MDRTWGFTAGRPPVWDEHAFKEGDELDAALITLERNRRTFAWKCAGLDAEALRRRLGRSDVSLGGLLLHLAWVEELYFQTYVAEQPVMPPFDQLTTDEDWETWPWQLTATEGPDALRALWEESVHRSREALTAALRRGGLEQVTSSGLNLRRVLVDLIEEYARHTGHADLLREEIDGSTGENPPREFPVP